MIDVPKSSMGLPASSVSRPIRNGHQSYHQRTSSNASSGSKRGSHSSKYWLYGLTFGFCCISVSFDNQSDNQIRDTVCKIRRNALKLIQF